MNRSGKIPVIFIHRGMPKYLKTTVLCAKKSSNKVILLGDNENEGLEGVWSPIEEYRSALFEQFKKVYVNLSPNDKWFELVCFERYFILLEFMKRNSLKEGFLVDSDMLLLVNNKALITVHDFEMAADCEEEDGQAYPCVMYWTVGALEQFVQFCLEMYTDEDKRQSLINIYKDCKRRHVIETQGGVSDMTLLYLWMKETTCKCNSHFLNGTNYFIDGNCNIAEQAGCKYEMGKILKIKKIIFKKGKPYIVDPCSKKLKRLVAIHCQGEGKKYIDLLYREIQFVNAVWTVRKFFSCKCKR